MVGTQTTRIISLGGGTQSSAMTLMADRGIFGEVPDAAIFADTGWDPPEVRAMVEYLATVVSFPVDIVAAGSLPDDLRAGVNTSGTRGFQAIPAFMVGASGRRGMSRRQCTREYKIAPIIKRAREHCGLEPRQHAAARGVHLEQWMGISVDEWMRMKDAREKWITTRYPLIEWRMTRADCIAWWASNAPVDAPPLTRSACVGCPYHTAAEWLDLSESHPEMIADAAAVESAMQEHNATDRPGSPTPYLHRRRIPLLLAVEADRESAQTHPPIDDDGSCDSGYCFS